MLYLPVPICTVWVFWGIRGIFQPLSRGGSNSSFMKKTAKIALVLLAFVMLASFTDVPQDNWAYPYVSNAQNVGLMIGDGDGYFRPRDYTTKEEVATIIYRILNYGTANMVPKERELTEAETALLERCQISDWARLYLLDGFASGFWTEADFAERSSDRTAGKYPLSREKLAQWMVNAEGIKVSMVSVLGYNDIGQASADMMKYIDACRRTGLMIGDDINEFHPKDGVNRAEVAVILTRALKYSEDGSEASAKVDVYGPVSSSGSANATIYITEGGIRKAVFIDPSAKILLNGAESNINAVKALNGRTAIVSSVIGSGTVIVQTKAVVTSGTVEDVRDAGSYKIVDIRVGQTLASYIFNSNTYCTVSLQKGISVRFVSDGSNLLEIN